MYVSLLLASFQLWDQSKKKALFYLFTVGIQYNN